MLIGEAVDAEGVVQRGLTVCALICCTLVALSFGLFVVDRTSTASKQQATQVDSGGGQAATAQTSRPGEPRRFIDDAARSLTSPFRSVISSHSQWTEEIATTLLALAVYGLGLGFLARYSRMI